MPPKVVINYSVGDLVFAKVKGYSCSASIESQPLPGYKTGAERYPVFFFSTYETNRFVDLCPQYADELTCGICAEILSAPVVTTCCGQSYCGECMNAVMNSGHKLCPNCRHGLSAQSIQSAPKVLVNLLSILNMNCEYSAQGCTHVCPQESMTAHVIGCDPQPSVLNMSDSIIAGLEEAKMALLCELCQQILVHPMCWSDVPNTYLCQRCAAPEGALPEREGAELRDAPDVVVRMIHMLVVKCNYEHLGCGHTCPLSEMESHMANDCQYNPIRKCSVCETVKELNEPHDCIPVIMTRLAKLEVQVGKILAEYPIRHLPTPVSMDVSIDGQHN